MKKKNVATKKPTYIFPLQIPGQGFSLSFLKLIEKYQKVVSRQQKRKITHSLISNTAPNVQPIVKVAKFIC